MADWVPITDPNDPRLANTPLNESQAAPPANENWDQFQPVSAAPTAAAAAPPAEDFSQFEAHKGLASNRDLVFQSLKDYGATPTATAAILGDIQQESEFNPRGVGDRGTSFGLMQVGGPMFRQFEADQARKGIAPGSQDYVYNQAPFVLDRFKRQHPDRWEAMQNASTSTDALKIFRSTPDWGYGIAGKRHQYAQSYEEAIKGVPVEQVDKEIRVEKAIPVNVREMQVARARPVNGQTPAPETAPAPAAAEDWSQFAEVKLPSEEEAAAAPRAVATQPWYERAYAALQKGDYGTALQTFDIAAQQGVRRALNLPIRGPVTEQNIQEAMTPSATPLVGGFLPREERTSAEMAQTTKIPPGLVNPIIQKAGYNLLVDTVNFVNTPEGAAIAAATGVAGAVEPAIARFTTLGFAADSARSAINAAMEGRWADALESMGMTGLLGHGARQAAKAEFPVARPVPGVVAPGEAQARGLEPIAPEAAPEAPAAAAPEAAPPLEAPVPAPPEAPPVEAPPEAAPVEAPPVEAPPEAAPVAPPEAQGIAATEIKSTLGETGKGAVTSMYDMMFKKLEAGDLTEGGGPSRALQEAYPVYQAGRIKSAEDLQQWINTESSYATKRPAAPAPVEDFSQFEEVTPEAAPAAPEPDAPETATATATQVTGQHIYSEVPLDKIVLSKDVPQFKSGADAKGIVEPLAGKYVRAGTPPVQLWERLNGQLELISGRHRFELAQRTGEKSIPSQIYREADGFTKHQAAMLDAEINIRDQQGSIADYANYFKHSGITQEAAEARGLLARGKGQAGFSIAQGGSESLFALHQSGRLTDAQAQAIVEAAPGNEGLQRIGIQAALDGHSAVSTANLIRSFKAKLAAEPELSQPDLLGQSDTAMQEMAKAGQRAGKLQREIGQRIIAVEGAARHPEKAKALGVKVGDPASVAAKAKELKALQERASAKNWDMDEQVRELILHSDMSPEQMIKALSKRPPRPPQEAGGGALARPAPAEEFTFGAPETVKEQKARMAREKAQAKALATEAEKKAKLKYGWQQKLSGTTGDLGQQELGGVVPGPEAPELFRPGAQPQTLPRQITPTPAGITERAAGAPMAEADIRNYLSLALDIPVRVGMKVAGGMQRALGVYRVKQETIRTKLRNDIPTIAHEVGHYVHHLLFTDPATGKPSEFANTFDRELLPLGRPTSLPSYTPERVRLEGVAEFTREWLTDRAQALAKAPDFTPFFEGELQNKFPQTWEIFDKARSDIAKFIAQPGWQKAQSRIVFDPKKPRTQFRDWLSRKYTEWFNELAPIDRTMKKLTTFGLDPATAQRVSERAINYKGGWRGKADFDLEFDQTNIEGNKVGPGLKAVLNGLDPKELSDFSTYLALKRAAEKKAQGIRTGFEQDLADPEVQKHMARLAPRYDQKAKELTRFNHNNLQLLVESGFFTPEQAARMEGANQDYVPFYRIYEDVKAAGPRGTAKSGGFVNTSSGVLRMKGSDRQIIDPLESSIKNTYAFRDLAERNRIGREFVDAVEQTQGGGRIGESVMKPVKPSRVSHEELAAHLEKLGLDENDINSLGPDIGMTLWRATNGIKPSDGVFRVWDKGKERLFQVDDPDLLKALSLSDSTDAAALKMLPLFKPFQMITRALRTGATLTPEFMARNPFRDQVTGAVFSRYGFVPFFDGFRGMLSVLGKDQYYKDWVKAGGRYSGLYDIEGPTIRKTLERVIRDPNALEQAWQLLRHPLQTLGAASGAFEHATRVGEFRKAIDAGADPMVAANASKDVTLNFSRAGVKGKLANQVLAFFNAGLQDVDKFARAHREAPVRTATKAFMYITVPSILTWTLGKDDPQIQNLPEWRKDFFWNLNVKGTVISLPKPFLLGAIYGTSVEKALDYANGRDPNAVRKALSAIYQVGSPARGDMIAATNAFKPLLENMTNYSFFQQKPLVSQSQQQLSPGLQFAPNTSETAKFVGKKLNQSPIMIDNLIRGYFGGLGRYGTDITDWVMLKAQAADSPAPPAKAISQYPLVRGFVKQPYEQSAYVQRFYAALDRAETRLNDMRTYGQRLDSPGMRDFLKENRDQLVWYNAGHGDGTLMTELRKTRDNLSDINKAMVAVQQSRGIDPEEKSKRLLKLGEMRDKLAEAVFKTYIHPSDREKVF